MSNIKITYIIPSIIISINPIFISTLQWKKFTLNISWNTFFALAAGQLLNQSLFAIAVNHPNYSLIIFYTFSHSIHFNRAISSADTISTPLSIRNKSFFSMFFEMILMMLCFLFNWHTTLLKFKMYNVFIWYTSNLQNNFHCSPS